MKMPQKHDFLRVLSIPLLKWQALVATIKGTARQLVRKHSKVRAGIEGDFVLVRLVLSIIIGDVAVELGVWVFDLFVCEVNQKPSPSEVS